MRKTLLLLLAVTACGDDGNGTTPDAAHGGSDAAHDSRPDARPDAAPATALSHTLFLETEGVTITPGADDANNNTSAAASHVAAVGAYLANDLDRTTKIAAIVADLTTVVAPYDITVTTTRPPAGTYTMIVVTDDTSQGIVGVNGVQFVVSENCTPAGGTASGVAFLFSGGTRTGFTVEQQSLAMFAELQQIPGTTKVGDCMNWNGTSFSAVCTIGGAGTPTATMPNCGGAPTVDEAGAFLAAFGTAN